MWKDKGIVFRPKSNGFDDISVKDPSIVHHDNLWHLCYTAIGNTPQNNLNVTCGLARAKNLSELNSADRIEMGKLWPNYTGSFVAPQLFRFDERETWYIVAQTSNGGQPRYQPVFSENKDITNPQGWSEPKIMTDLESICPIPTAIDFWVIRQTDRFWLFFSDQQANLWALWTTTDEFPYNFRDAKIVLTDKSGEWELHEAAHIYYAVDIKKYIAVIEYYRYGTWTDYLNRFIRAFVADTLPGPWKPLDRPEQFFGQKEQVISESKLNQVSHPEFLRMNNAENMEITSRSPIMIQETIKPNSEDKYLELQWHIRLMERVGPS